MSDPAYVVYVQYVNHGTVGGLGGMTPGTCSREIITDVVAWAWDGCPKIMYKGLPTRADKVFISEYVDPTQYRLAFPALEQPA